MLGLCIDVRFCHYLIIPGSTDTEYLASGGADKMVLIWRLFDGHVLEQGKPLTLRHTCAVCREYEPFVARYA